MSDASNLLVIILCSFLLAAILLFCVLFLIYKRAHHVTDVKSNLTTVLTQHLTPSPKNDVSSELPDVTSGYSGSGSGTTLC